MSSLILLFVQSLSPVWLFATPWTAACQASLSITNSQSLLTLMSIELVMPSNNLILCCPLLLLPSILEDNKILISYSEFKLFHYIKLCIVTVLYVFKSWENMLLLLLSHFRRVRLCATPQTAAHQAPLSLGFSRQEHWSGLPFPWEDMREKQKGPKSNA